MRLKLWIWPLLAVLVVLAARATVYALTPTRGALLQELADREGGPHLAGVLTTGVAAAALVAAAVLWLAVVAVRERLALEGRPLVAPPRLRPLRLAVRALALFAASSLGFALLESTIHWRAGLGWHGLSCLVGPVHRDAIPVIAALVLVVVAAHGAIELLLAWARRLVAQLAARVHGARPAAPAAAAAGRPRPSPVCSVALPRGPPQGPVPAGIL